MTKRPLLSLCAVILSSLAAGAAEHGYIVETGGVQIAFPTGWEPLDQPSNFYVQKRGRNTEEGIALSAGSFKPDLTLEQYAALGVAGLVTGTESLFEKIAERMKISREELERAVASEIGRQTMESLKEASRTMRFELLKVSKEEITGTERYEIHSKVTVVKSGQVIYSRVLLMRGSSPGEIVQITYAGPSEGTLTRKDLVDGIRPKTKSK